MGDVTMKETEMELYLRVLHQNQILRTRELELEILKMRSQSSSAADAFLPTLDSAVNTQPILPVQSATSLPLATSELSNQIEVPKPSSTTTNWEPMLLNDSGLFDSFGLLDSLPSLPEEHALHLLNFDWASNPANVAALYPTRSYQHLCNNSDCAINADLKELLQESPLINPSSSSSLDNIPVVVGATNSANNTARNSATSAPSTNVRETSAIKLKKKYIEQQVSCMKCRSSVGKILLHCTSKCGASTEVLASYCVNVECSQCLSIHKNHSPKDCETCRRTKRKRGNGPDNTLVCNVCKKNIGQGGFRCLSYAHCSDNPCPGHLKNLDKTSLDIEGHKSEVICESCSCKYEFCTECGGGGTFRTGKYRPRDLFPNRKTCSLSHVRLSGHVLETEFTCLSQIDSETLESMRQVHYESLCYQLAVPDVIESTIAFSSFAAISDHTVESWSQILSLQANYQIHVCLGYLDPKKLRKASSSKYLAGFSYSYQKGYVLYIDACIRTLSSSCLSTYQHLISSLVLHSAPTAEYVCIYILEEHEKMKSLIRKLGFFGNCEGAKYVEQRKGYEAFCMSMADFKAIVATIRRV